VPMIQGELTGRKGKQADGSAKTREAKLGCVFTQTTTDARGFPVRDPDSTSFVGAIESAEDFGWRMYGEAARRGLSKAERVVILADGAEWIKNLAQMHFPEATLIIDLYHARQHVSELCKTLFVRDEKKVKQQRMRWWTAFIQKKPLLEGLDLVKEAVSKHATLPILKDVKINAEGEGFYLHTTNLNIGIRTWGQRGKCYRTRHYPL
jgi:hypothetical protein